MSRDQNAPTPFVHRQCSSNGRGFIEPSFHVGTDGHGDCDSRSMTVSIAPALSLLDCVMRSPLPLVPWSRTDMPLECDVEGVRDFAARGRWPDTGRSGCGDHCQGSLDQTRFRPGGGACLQRPSRLTGASGSLCVCEP